MQRDFSPTFLAAVLTIFLAAITIPYLAAWLMEGEQWIFSGILLNPLDGNTYLAKIMQGVQGSWKFRLPYTADAEATTFIFIFYLALGHLARLIDVSPVLIFHLARAAGSIFLFVVLVIFIRQVLPEQKRRTALILVLFGSGLGWLGVPFGIVGSDFWVAEAYPFLSAFSNPHFPIGLSCLLIILLLAHSQESSFSGIFVSAFLLAVILPFGLIVAGIVMTGSMLARWLSQRVFPAKLFLRLAAIGAAGIGPAAYYLYAIQSDPQLRLWNQQNITPSPSVFDLFLSFSPALLTAVLALVSFQRGDSDDLLPAVGLWLVIGAVLIYFPWSLQRRFLMGYFIPCGILAAWGLYKFRWGKWVEFGLISASLVTNLVLMLTIFFGIGTHAKEYYLSADEAAALTWITGNTDRNDVILASPDFSLFIPAQTGRRVIYGHPYETVQAERMKLLATSFYEGSLPDAELQNLLMEVDYILLGSQEVALGGSPSLDSYRVVFKQGLVTIFAVKQSPR